MSSLVRGCQNRLIVITLCLGAVVAAPLAAQNSSAPPRVRPGRLVGVYDAPSGAPLDDVTVTNTQTGLSAKTTRAGTLTLFFVDTVGGLVRFQRLGYQPQMMVVANSDHDTTPLTILMEPVAQKLAPVVTTARSRRGPGDTVQVLEKNGFYDRRNTTGAPWDAFVTAEQLSHLTLLSDATRLSTRGFCRGNLYVDGVLIANLTNPRVGPGRRLNTYRHDPIDQLLSSDQVAGVELYAGPDVPAEYGANCATLIWTKR